MRQAEGFLTRDRCGMTGPGPEAGSREGGHAIARGRTVR
jgi:hypothetical protein